MAVTLADIAAALGVAPPPDAGRAVTGIAAVADAGATDLTLVGSPGYARALLRCPARAAIVQRKIKLPVSSGVPSGGAPGGASPGGGGGVASAAGVQRTIFRVDDVEAAVAAVLPLFAPAQPRMAVGIHPTALIGGDSQLREGCAVGPYVVVGNRCRIGAGVELHPGVVIGDDCTIGDGCQLHPNVVLRQRVTLGNRVIVHAGAVLGTDGFGYRWDGRRHAKIAQIGTVVIEDDVEIGSLAAIDRARFGVTRVGHGTKIDNLVQIAHNVQVGPHCIIVGQTGIAGSTTLGTGVVLGGQTAVRDHITLGDAATAAARSAIATNVPPQTSVSGMPALPHRQSLREQAALRRLPELLVQVRKLQEEIGLLKRRGT